MAIHFPLSGYPDAAVATCGLSYIRQRLGRDDYKSGRMVTYVSRLIEKRGFPQPLPSMSVRKPDLIDGVTVNSRWLRPAVDQWFDDFLPPAAALALDEAARKAAAADMDAAAANLGRLRVVGGLEA